MSVTDAGILIVAVFGLVGIIALVRFRKKVKLEITGPLNTKLNLEAANAAAAGVQAQNLKSAEGGLKVRDETGRGADVRDVEVKQDIEISAKAPDPKA